MNCGASFVTYGAAIFALTSRTSVGQRLWNDWTELRSASVFTKVQPPTKVGDRKSLNDSPQDFEAGVKGDIWS